MACHGGLRVIGRRAPVCFTQGDDRCWWAQRGEMGQPPPSFARVEIAKTAHLDNVSHPDQITAASRSLPSVKFPYDNVLLRMRQGSMFIRKGRLWPKLKPRDGLNHYESGEKEPYIRPITETVWRLEGAELPYI